MTSEAHNGKEGTGIEPIVLDLSSFTPIAGQFAGGCYPKGDEFEYPSAQNDQTAKNRVTSEEAKEKEAKFEETLRDIRHAAEAHRQTRQTIRKLIKPGIKIIDMAETLEELARKLVGANGIEAGLAFPTGCSLNHCAAHWSPNGGDATVLQYSDVMKVDFGTHVNGRIIDSAFTVNFDPKFNPLVEAVKAATYAGVKAAGIDVRLCDVGAEIQEVMESHEIELEGKTYPIKCIRNLCGHSLGHYRIHASKIVPIIKGGEKKSRMEEYEFYAIETFGTTGRGRVVESGENSHYMKSPACPKNPPIRREGPRKLYQSIDKNFASLAFCRRWLDRLGHEKYMPEMRFLVETGLVEEYPPLCDVKGSYTAQWEHTLVLRPSCKEILSKGDDY